MFEAEKKKEIADEKSKHVWLKTTSRDSFVRLFIFFLKRQMDQCLPLPPSHYVCAACEKCKLGGAGNKDGTASQLSFL